MKINIEQIKKKKKSVIFSVVLLFLSCAAIVYKEPQMSTFLDCLKVIVFIAMVSTVLSWGNIRIFGRLQEALSLKKTNKRCIVLGYGFTLVMNIILCMEVLFGEDYFNSFFAQAAFTGVYIGTIIAEE